MPRGADAVHGTGDLAVGVHDEGGADDAGDGAAVKLLFAVGAPLGEDGLVGVGQEGEVQALGVAEARELGGWVGGDAQDGEAGVVEFAEVVAEVAGLLGAAGGAGGWVEVDDYVAAAEVGELDLGAGGVGEGEVGGWVAFDESVGHDGGRYRTGPRCRGLRLLPAGTGGNGRDEERGPAGSGSARRRRRGSGSGHD